MIHNTLKSNQRNRTILDCAFFFWGSCTREFVSVLFFFSVPRNVFTGVRNAIGQFRTLSMRAEKIRKLCWIVHLKASLTGVTSTEQSFPSQNSTTNFWSPTVFFGSKSSLSFYSYSKSKYNITYRIKRILILRQDSTFTRVMPTVQFRSNKWRKNRKHTFPFAWRNMSRAPSLTSDDRTTQITETTKRSIRLTSI